jgi:Asp-tRNA(Asn)/Glu-tRNA(Gln) amidotransferase A subunit family amidase
MSMNMPYSIAEAARSIRDGLITPAQLVEQCLSAIDKYEGRLHAWAVVDADNALSAADRLGRELHAGAYRGPLHGIPVGIKDIYDVRGLPTRAGSPLRENSPAAENDAPLVSALRRAGAIILGKTVTVEFACFDPSPTRNPWDVELRHTPGGSSSGSAVAVAAGMCFGALGTQTGGSLVRPASYCGIATMKPTFGLLSRDGIIPVSHHFDHPGPMARTVGDLRILMQCLAEDSCTISPRSLDNTSTISPLPLGENSISSPLPLGKNSISSPLPLGENSISSPLPLGENSISSPLPLGKNSISSPLPLGEGQGEGLSRPPRLGVLEKFFIDESHPDVRRVIEETISKLRNAGAEIKEVQTALDFSQVARMHRLIMAVEAAEYHREQFAAHREKYGPMITALLDEGLKIPGVDYASALAWQREFSTRVNELFADCDALLAPSTDTTAPATLTTTGTPKFQAPWSCAGVPVVSIPCGLAADAMPVGLQIIGPHIQDAALLDTAQWCEKIIGFDKAPPTFDQ